MYRSVFVFSLSFGLLFLSNQSSSSAAESETSTTTGASTDSEDTGSDPNSVVCVSQYGICEYFQSGDEIRVRCECVDGSGTGEVTGGDNENEDSGGDENDTGLTEEELLEACHEELEVCEPFIPPDSGVRCENEYGTCTVSNEDEDLVECKCVNGLAYGGTGGDDWADLTQEELLEICHVELRDCKDDETSEGETGEDTQSDDDTAGTSTTTTDGDPTDTASDSDSPDDDSDEGDDGASDTGPIDPHDIFDCRIASTSDWKLLALAGLGLLGLTRIRRRKRPTT